jgi:hypothetical protein
MSNGVVGNVVDGEWLDGGMESLGVSGSTMWGAIWSIRDWAAS